MILVRFMDAARFLPAEVEFLHLFIVEEPEASIFDAGDTEIEDITPVGCTQGFAGVLFNDEEGDAPFGVDRLDLFIDIFDSPPERFPAWSRSLSFRRG